MTYVPVPHWTGTEWVPCNHCGLPKEGDPQWNCYKLMAWPDGFDPAEIPPPKYNIGEFVRFHWSGGVRNGEIRGIQKHGGSLCRGEEVPPEVFRAEYAQPADYTIYWNGHGRGCKERYILSEPK